MSKYTINLDLLVNETFDITYKGSIIKVRKPPEEMVYKLSERIKEMRKDGFEMEQGLQLTADMASQILSNNEDGTQYSVEWVQKNIPLDARSALMMSYMEFITDISKDPN